MGALKHAFVDYWSLTQNYSRGDIVQTYNPLSGGLEGFPGMVTAVHPGIGFIDVEFPWGNERVSPEFLVKQNPRFLFNYPSFIDTSYQSWDIDRSHLEDGTEGGYNYALPRLSSTTDAVTLLAAEYDVKRRKLRIAASQCRYHGLNDIDMYIALSSVMGRDYSDHAIRTAIYWSAPGRQYKMNRGEMDDGLPNCPRCSTNLQKTNYKKHTRLYVCPSCLFCIKPSDIEGLETEGGFGVPPGETDLIDDALRSAAATLKWNTLKKQIISYIKSKHRKQAHLAEDVAVTVTAYFASEMNIHEDRLTTTQLAKEVDPVLLQYWEGDLKKRVFEAARTSDLDFHDKNDAIDVTMSYINSLDNREILAVDDKEIERLLKAAKDIENDKIHRYSTGLRAVLASISPKPLEVRSVLGKEELQGIYDIVRGSSRSDTLATQFVTDFNDYGLGDALFLLGASTADGLFDRIAYNNLVDTLERVRGDRS